jgi:predicted GTPase
MDIAQGDSNVACTTEMKKYSVILRKTKEKFIMIDSPGLDNNNKDDDEKTFSDIQAEI